MSLVTTTTTTSASSPLLVMNYDRCISRRRCQLITALPSLALHLFCSVYVLDNVTELKRKENSKKSVLEKQCHK